MKEQPRSLPVYYAVYVLAMLIFGTNGYVASNISFQGSQVVLFRTLIGGALLTVLVLLRGGFDRSALRAEALPLLLGGAALGFNWIALFEAFRLLNVSLATLIYYAGPMLILLFSPLLFQLCVVAVGLVCISGSIAFGGMNTIGLVTALVSALFYASLIAFNKRISQTAGMQTAAIELDTAFIVVLIYVMLTVGLPHPKPSDIPYIAVMGFINTGLAYLLYFSGLQKLPAQSVALISYVDPVSALLFSFLLLHETMTSLQIHSRFSAPCLLSEALCLENLRTGDENP